MEIPNYKNYSLDELKEALYSLDKNIYPDRAIQIENEINNKQNIKNDKFGNKNEIELIKDKAVEYDFNSINIWFLYIIAILQIGGGYLGIITCMQSIFSSINIPTVIITIPFLSLFLFGIYAGILLLEKKSKGINYSIINFGIQIPYFTSPVLSFYFHSGTYIDLSVGIFNFNYNYLLGSSWYFSILNREIPFALGINLIALIIFIILDRISKRNKIGSNS
ncbi:MAG: hypothetical protein JXR46_06240 [Calditrichaceae bacterium]|nr:hypothetical protein [Calditrichaceae bacterium]MBN2708626.1 hypothetical protein [Calditrichaceae bacterium]RQV95476.1 MAG: hypothetical protein EH224_07600 [Calditrichota bacterium]